MKDGLENIDEIFKQAFDGFESNVDPSVWNNIQSSIGAGTGSTPQLNPTNVAGGVAKSVAMKIVAGVVLMGSVATGTYFVVTANQEKENIVSENVITDDIIMEQALENEIPVSGYENSTITDNPSLEKASVSVEESSTDTKEITTDKTSGVTQKDENNGNPSLMDESSSDGKSADKSTPALETPADKGDTKTKSETPKQQKTPEPKPELEVKINVDVTRGKAPLTVTFDAIGNGNHYFWDFKDGSDLEYEESTAHTFFKEGTYRVALQAIDNENKPKTEYITIIVEKNYDSSLEALQNVITPNGDGQNDVYKIRGNNIAKVEAVIMDKTGKPIYTIKSMDDYWDGKDQSGNYVIQGQYYLSGMAIGADGKKHLIKQSINVLN